MTKWIGKMIFLGRQGGKLTLFCVFFLLFSSQVFAATYYISPTGSDSNNGTTTAAPIATFTHAYTIMSSGDTLMLMDGTYQQQLFPPVALSGSSGSPTTFEAVNTGEAIIAPDEADLDADFDTRSSLYVYSNTSRGRMSYFDFTGLFVIGAGEHNAIGIYSMDFADPDTEMTHHINLRKCGAKGSAVDYNVSATEIMGSTDILFEDGYSFGFGRKAMEVYGARNVTVRRTVVRFDWWEGDSYKPNDPRVNITCYNTLDSVFENIISIDAGPSPVGANPDRPGLVLSGNDAGGTGIQGTDNSGYYGCIVLNNQVPSGVFNGIEVNGGSGSPATNLTLKDILIWDQTSYGINLQDNVDGIDISYITMVSNGLTALRVNSSPAHTIADVTASYNVAKDNGGYGFYNITTTNSSATGNSDADVDATHMPTILYPPTNTPVEGYPRGADVTKRYVGGVKTSTSLWPWNIEGVVKAKMCNATYLQEIENKINGYDGTSITYNPGLCASGKPLTNYIWEYAGTSCPENICGATTNITPPTINSITTNSSL